MQDKDLYKNIGALNAKVQALSNDITSIKNDTKNIYELIKTDVGKTNSRINKIEATQARHSVAIGIASTICTSTPIFLIIKGIF